MDFFKLRMRDILLFLLILGLCFGISILMQEVFEIPEQITTTFAFAVLQSSQPRISLSPI